MENRKLFDKFEQQNTKINFFKTENYQKPVENIIDLRSAIHPRRSAMKITLSEAAPVYHQVFENKTGFLPNLSIVDLLFNEGPASKAYLFSIFEHLDFKL